jgi:hypothetical protein
MHKSVKIFLAPLSLLLGLAYAPVCSAEENPGSAAQTASFNAGVKVGANEGTSENSGAGASAEQAGIFKKVQGAVSVRPAGAVKARARSVVSGDALAVGERVHAGKDAGASFTLSDGTELVLGARSSAVVREYAFDSTTQEGNILIDFLGGQLRVISGLISKKSPEKLKVQAPSAVVGVRGTDFVLEAKAVDE